MESAEPFTATLKATPPSVPEGWQLVPKRMDADMLRAFRDLSLNGIKHGWEAALAAAPKSPSVPDGWVLVPVKPTLEMIRAGIGYEDLVSEYKAMLEAAPKPGDAP